MLMKKIVLFLLMALPMVVAAQREITIEGPSDLVSSVTVNVDSEFNQNTGRMTLTFTGFECEDANTLWILKDSTDYKKIKKYFRKNKGSLKRSGYSRKQISFFNLKGKTAFPTIDVTGADILDWSVQTNAAPKRPIQNQLLPLDNHSKLILKLKVQDDAESVKLNLKNPTLLIKKHKKSSTRYYKLSFIGEDTSVDFDIAREFCEKNAHLLVELKEYDSIFGKCESAMKDMKTKRNGSLGDVKAVAVEGLAQIDMKRFENTHCKEIDDEYNKFKALASRIRNFDVSSDAAGGAGGGGGAGASGGSGGGGSSDGGSSGGGSDE